MEVLYSCSCGECAYGWTRSVSINRWDGTISRNPRAWDQRRDPSFKDCVKASTNFTTVSRILVSVMCNLQITYGTRERMSSISRRVAANLAIRVLSKVILIGRRITLFSELTISSSSCYFKNKMLQSIRLAFVLQPRF